MVFFICNHCGESLKKQVVEKHGYRCKRELSVSCMDCNKDFYGKEYDAHTSCISEIEKYSDKNYVPKANANKGARKQETWISTIRAITEAKRNLPKGVTSVFEVIQRNDNIPRKMKGFMNFFQNSAKYIRKPDVEAAWSLIEEEVKRSKPQPVEPAAAKTSEQKPSNETNTALTNGSSAKRKQEPEQVPEQPAGKKRKTANVSNGTQNGHSVEAVGNGTSELHAAKHDDQTDGSEKFRWNDVMRSLLVSKNNQMKLSKLKKKVLKRYRQFSDGAEGKFEKKFSKKLLKTQFVVESDTVRLVA